MQNGRLCDEEGNVGPEAFEEAFRDLLRHYAQRRLADCASGTAGPQEAEAAQLGALKMLMLNLERAELSGINPTSIVDGVGCARKEVLDDFISSRESTGMQHVSMIDEGSASHYSTAAGDSRIDDANNPNKGGIVGTGGCHGTSNDLQAIAKAIKELVWEQQRISAAQETTAATVEEFLSWFRGSLACSTVPGVDTNLGHGVKEDCTLAPGAVASRLVQTRLDAERSSKAQPADIDKRNWKFHRSSAACDVDDSACLRSPPSEGQRFRTVDTSKGGCSETGTDYSCRRTGPCQPRPKLLA